MKKALTILSICLIQFIFGVTVFAQEFELTPTIQTHASGNKSAKVIKKQFEELYIGNAISGKNSLKSISNSRISKIWGKYLSTSYDDRFYSTTIDNKGNVISVGSIGAGTSDNDAFIYKCDASGNKLWSEKPATSSGTDAIYDVTTDKSGNIFITGAFSKSAFASNLYSNGNTDTFVAKYNPEGNLIWVKQGGGSDDDYGCGIKTDENGDVYVVGFFNGTAYFNDVSKTSSSQEDMFIAKYNGNNGNLDWIRTGNIGANNYLYGIGVDLIGNVYVGTKFSGSVSFSGSTIVNSTGGDDMLLIKYNTYGTFQWIKTGGGIGDEGINRTVVCPDGSILVAGYFSGTAQFGTKTLTSHGSFDIFAAKYSPAGNIIWAKQFGGTGSQSAWGICTDEKNNCYLTGWFSGTGAFDNTTIYSSGNNDAYLIKYDKNGNLVWVEPIATGDENQYCSRVAVAGNDIVVAGRYNGDSYIYGSYFSNEGGEDGFIAKFIQSEDPNNQVTVNPNLILSTPQVKAGQSITFSGKQFSPAGKADLNFTGPGILNSISDYIVDVYGNFEYTVYISSSQTAGKYQVTVTDKISGLFTSKMFEVIQNQSIVVDNNLKIVEPNMSKIRLVGDPITLAWEDQVKYNVNPLYNFKHSYKVEYKRDTNNSSGAWQFVENNQGDNPGYGKTNSSTSFTPTDAGTYVFRISDNYYPNRSAITPELVVSGSLAPDIKVEFKWDKSYTSPIYSLQPHGVAADGVARFYMVISNMNPLSSGIQKVKVTLSDSEVKEYQLPQFLGKVQYCSIQKDQELSTEANNANSVTAENNSSNLDSKYWFWYVAPEDFARNQGDFEIGDRVVTATFDITLLNGNSIKKYKHIFITRPPLMLVHGLNGDPKDTWGKFPSGNGNTLFVEDSRFKIKKAIDIEPNSHFKTNSDQLLGGIDKTNSFRSLINEMRNLGYACNQLDYVCHSMGGSVLRHAVDNEENYKVKSNYSLGFVHKFISIHTPHDGSSFANLLYDLDNMGINSGDIQRLASWFKLFKCGLVNCHVVDAVLNLRFKDGIKFSQTNVPSHLIGSSASCSEFNFKTNALLNVLKLYFFPPKLWFKDNCSLFSDYFSAHGYENDFLSASDAIVSVSSQFSRNNVNFLPTYCSWIPGSMHNSTFGDSPTKSQEVGKEVDKLLNSNVKSNLFYSIPATNVSTSKKAKLLIEEPLVIVENKIKISYPTNNAEFYAGDTMTIKLQVDTLGLKGFALYFQDQSFYNTPASPNVEYKLIISPEYIEGQNIYVMCGYSISDTTFLSYANLDIKINPVGSILDFNVIPEVLMIEKGNSRKPDYEAIFPNAIAQIGQTDLFNVVIKNPDIVAYDGSTNQFNGLSKGSTNALVTYRGISKTVFFDIIQDEEPPIDPVTDINDIEIDRKDQLNVKIYPNPVTNELTIEIKGNTIQPNFEIINSSGQVIFKGTVFEKAVVQTEDFVPGVYLVKFESGNKFEFKKVIKISW